MLDQVIHSHRSVHVALDLLWFDSDELCDVVQRFLHCETLNIVVLRAVAD